MKTRDIDVRESLHKWLEDEFRDDPDTIILDELQVCYGVARVDVAVVNGALHGYEIKSDSDTLKRLPKQAESYGKVFDYMTLVCSEKFLSKTDTIIPEWWGVSVATVAFKGDIIVHTVRSPKRNTIELDAFSLCQLLWRDEVLAILSENGLDKGIRKLPKFRLWQHLAENLPIEQIQESVKRCLRQRVNWRVDALHRLGDG